MAVIGERQVTGGNGRNREIDLLWSDFQDYFLSDDIMP